MDPKLEQELADMMAELRNSMQGLPDSAKNAEQGLKAFGKATAKGSVDITKGLGDLALKVGAGDTSFKSLNRVVDITSGALAGMAKTVPYAGEAVAAGITAAAEAAKFMLDQMDQVAKGFNEMASVGALTADGMTGLARQFTQSGLGLQSFTKLVADNSQALARMSGIAGDGAETFSQAIGQLTQGNDNSLRKLGMNADAIGQTVGAFVTQQTRLGRTQNLTATQLAEGAKQYAKELDVLGKLTGLSREQLQKEQDAALSDSRFRANYEEMIANGNKAQADALMNLKIRFGRFDKELGQGIMDLTSGAANTESARKLMNSTGGAAQDIIARLKAGEITEAQANQELVAAFKANKEKLIQQGKYVADADSAFNRLPGVLDAIAAGEKSNDDVAKETQRKQLENTDDLTKSTVEAQKEMEKLSRTITQAAIDFMPDAAKATKAVAKQMNELAKYIRDTLGTKGAGPDTGGPSGVSGEFGGAGAAADAGGPASDAEIAAARKSVAAQGGGGGVGPPAVAAEDYIRFSGGTGDKAHFDKLDPGVRSQFLQMAVSYNQLTGKKLQVNSAFRSPEEQAGVNSGSNPKAAPGRSLHNVGRALDIQSDQRQFLEQKGLLSQYGFKPLAGDPPHISAAAGAILSGPMGGYQPNLTMHGTEAIVPINTPAVANSGTGAGSADMLQQQLAKIEELATIFKSQLSIDQKLLSYSS